jgi:hypothetical protein
MSGLWYIGDNRRLKNDLIINLNGPFHYIVGDKSGIVRSEIIKERMLKHYGFTNFCQIDFREWEAKTHNQRAVTEFLENIIKF